MNRVSQKTWIILTTLATLILMGLQYMSLNEHHDYWWDKIPGFWAVYGFVGCWLIVVVSKKLGKLFIQSNNKGGSYAE